MSALDVLFDSDWHSRPWKDVRNAVVSSCEQTYFMHQLEKTTATSTKPPGGRRSTRGRYNDLLKRRRLKKEAFK